jgi:hypothetical protein
MPRDLHPAASYPPTLLDDQDEDGEPLTYSEILNVWYAGHICYALVVLHAS